MKIFLLLPLFILSLSAHAAESNCAAAFRADARFEWESWPDIERKPPAIFPSKMAALLVPHMENLPAGLNEEESAFYGGIAALLHDRHRVFDLINEVQAELPSDAKEADLLALMSQYEEAHGFRVQTVTELLTPKEWLSLINDGYTFRDSAGLDIVLALNGDMPAYPGHWRHGEWTHRFQLHLLLRDLKKNPELYGSPKDVLALYKRLGDRAWAKTLDWSETGLILDGVSNSPLGLFYHLFDSAENNATSPGFFYEYRAHWPALPLK